MPLPRAFGAPYDQFQQWKQQRVQVSVEHPTGEFTVELRMQNGQLAGWGLSRTARLLFDGDVLITQSIWRNEVQR